MFILDDVAVRRADGKRPTAHLSPPSGSPPHSHPPAGSAADDAKDKTAYVSVLAPSLLRLGVGSGSVQGLTRHNFSVLGCVILASVLRLPAAASQQFADSVAALPADELAKAAADPSASRSLESFLQGALCYCCVLCCLLPLFSACAVCVFPLHRELLSPDAIVVFSLCLSPQAPRPSGSSAR